MKYSAIVLLGGSSTRFPNDINKVYLLINNKPVFLYSVEAFLSDNDCDEIIIVYNEKDKDIINKYNFDKRIKIVPGGSERYLSVLNGLNVVKNTYVLVHDGARPNINLDLINRVKEGLLKSKSVSLAVNVSDTIKKRTNDSIETIDRDDLYYMQTPQGSDTNALKLVLSKIKKEDKITDDLMAFEKYSDVVPLLVIGDKKNIKITTQDDFEYMKYLLENKNV